MSKDFGNVKGFYDALVFLDEDMAGEILFLIANKKLYDNELEEHREGGGTYSATAMALAAIYHAHNEAD